MMSQRRGKNVAIAGLAAQMIFAVVLLVIWLWTDSQAAMACMLLLAMGVPVWLMAALLFYVRQLARIEAAEAEELAARGGEAATIFQGQAAEIMPAASRAAFTDRWITPIFTLLWAGGLVAVGLMLARHLQSEQLPAIGNAGPGMLLSAVIGFAAFLFSRYATGMSRDANWRLLRAPGSFLVIAVLFVGAVIIALIAADQGSAALDHYIALVAAGVMCLLAAECVLNLILDLYRPHLPGEEARPSFDSRLCNLVAEPGRVGHSIADTLNYQFGFEVSKTWFYKLLAKAFLPLVVFGAMAMVGISSLVVVDQGHQAAVLHWGRVARVLGPGLHLTCPWPIDSVRRFDTGKVYDMVLGVGEHRQDAEHQEHEMVLWTQEHGDQEEQDFLLAVPPRLVETAADGQKAPPPVNIIKMVVTVQYTVDDVLKYGFTYADPQQMLEWASYREMFRYCASATLTSAIPGGAADRPEAIMTYGQARAAQELLRRIQARADQLGLGVKIVYVGFSGVHPPHEAAASYQKVLEAERRMLQTRYEAEGQANKSLVQVAGGPLVALRLALSIRTLEELSRLRDNPSQVPTIVAGQIGQIEDDIQALDREIAQERLLGKIRQGEDRPLDPKEQLRADYQAHLDMLRAVQANPKGFDLAGQIAAAEQTVDRQFDTTVGDPAKLVAEAEGYRWSQELTEKARAEAFVPELEAYKASPNMYRFDRWMDVWDEVLPGMTKYVIGVDRNKLEIWLNWEQESQAMEGAYQEQSK